MLRRWLSLTVLLLSLSPLIRADASLSRYTTVTVVPAKTSIYIGTVTLIMPALTRQSGSYTASYTAKVFPYFFYSEKGQLSIDVSDDDLHRLEKGEPITFTGRARSDTGDDRRVEGRAQPTDATGGKIKVRVFISKKTELIFNTTYQFPKN